MEALRTWARQLVILAVFAGLVEIALPRSSLRQPARLVLGLVLLLAVAAPALDLLHAPVRWEAALDAAAFAHLADYQGSAERLSKATGDLTRQELQHRLELAAEVAARQVPGVAGARARVELAEAAAGAAPAVRRVELWLRPAGVSRVAPVVPVGAPAPPGTVDPAAAGLAAAAAQAVARELGLPADRVTAAVTGG